MAECEKTVVISWLLPNEEQIREQMRTRFEGPPVICCFADYPPLPDERTNAYQRRVMPLLWAEMYPPKRSLRQKLMALLGRG